MSTRLDDNKPGWVFKLFRRYIRLCFCKLYYKRVYALDTANVPAQGPLMVVSDHQNGLCDVLGVLMTLPDRGGRKTRIVARADVFKPAFRRALHWLGLMPAYRLSFDGEESLANNAGTFEEMERELMHDGTVVLYPEAGHQDKRWLGQFSLAYLHVLFQAAEKTGFTKEFFVLPSCNHYADYFHARGEMLVRYGTPISIAPYYELYKTKPRTAQRQVNQLVRKQILDLMLHIDDLEHYDDIDFLRETYGAHYADRCGLDPQRLPEKLEADRRLVQRLDEARTRDTASVDSLYADLNRYRRALDALHIDDRHIAKPHGTARLIAEGIAPIALLPLFAVACVPNLLIYYAPRLITVKIKDRLLHSGFDFGVTALVSAPVLYASTCTLVWSYAHSWAWALGCLAWLPVGGLFMYRYMREMKRYRTDLHAHALHRRGQLDELVGLRKKIWKQAEQLTINY